MRFLFLCSFLAVAPLATPLFAEEAPAGPASGHVRASAEAPDAPDAYPHPILSQNTEWTERLLRTIGILFVAAAIIGPLVRANAPEEVPPAHSHDEPPGASHHHGSSGTHAADPH